MTASKAPARQLPIPPSAAIHTHIGELLRELRLARRLLRLAESAEERSVECNDRRSGKAVANVAG